MHPYYTIYTKINSNSNLKLKNWEVFKEILQLNNYKNKLKNKEIVYRREDRNERWNGDNEDGGNENGEGLKYMWKK